MPYIAIVVAAYYFAPAVRMHHRNVPLRREMKAQAVTFQTELRWAKIPVRPW